MMPRIVILLFQRTDNFPYLLERLDRIGQCDEPAAVVLEESFGRSRNALVSVADRVNVLFHRLKFS